MARKKVTLQYIAKDSARRTRFRNRLGSLMKKATELGTMCDVKTCLVVYGEGEAEPQVFPSHAEAVDILNEFKSMPELGHCKKTLDQEALLNPGIAKLRDQVDKTNHECEDGEIRYLLHKTMHGDLSGLVGLNIEELTKVGYKVDVLLKSIMERMAKIHSQAPPPAPWVTTGSVDMGSTALHQAPVQRQEGTLQNSGWDPGTQVYGGYAGGPAGAGFPGAGRPGPPRRPPRPREAAFAEDLKPPEP